MVSATLVKGSTLKVYPGFSNGMSTVNKDQINTDLLAFIGNSSKPPSLSTTSP
jgi:non-heme chloroperoxidase